MRFEEEEILEHLISHPHSIVLENHGKPYRCDGCLEVGFGSGFRCDPCNFDLHRECAKASSFTSHRFFGKHVLFKFMERTPGARARYCDACGRDVKGLVYHCEAKGWDLHPCCAHLPEVIRNEEVELRLKPKKASSSKCQRCGKNKHRNNASGWWYVSTDGEYKFHVACIKNMAVEEWKRRRSAQKAGTTTLALGMSEDDVFPLQIARRGGNGGGFRKYQRILKLVVKLLVSVLVGDPTAVFAGVVASLLTN
ncbi:hypothetical protein H6P81_006392 [Aristolochia fimbriata]|uniref:Phorbol-ester/DAG-type domain-containing protein n=1 Tax=Aristolochia fimbriata TaxID=158543 RepID=A0AAV7EXD3_ARIFI|nr:hypothetical protein H6P81_006392 [Aristolochia fimbriata]